MGESSKFDLPTTPEMGDESFTDGEMKEFYRQRTEHLLGLRGLDTLTGANNLEFFTAQLDHLLKSTPGHRKGEEKFAHVGLIYVDLDDFKMVNDTYGHDKGDEVLQKVVGALKSSVREKSDIVARIGGDELALILPGATLEIARRVAEKCRQAIAKLAFATNPDLPKLTIHASFGVASAEGSMDVATLRKVADDALYVEKNGRPIE